MIHWKDILNLVQHGNPPADKRIEKTFDQWKRILTDKQYFITRKKGTEPPQSNNCEIHTEGIYQCVCCKSKLFDTSIQYHSSSGWPSFSQPIKENAIKYLKDFSLSMERIEVQCNTCDAHLGHVFNDGPPPSRLRYCVNSTAIELISN